MRQLYEDNSTLQVKILHHYIKTADIANVIIIEHPKPYVHVCLLALAMYVLCSYMYSHRYYLYLDKNNGSAHYTLTYLGFFQPLKL